MAREGSGAGLRGAPHLLALAQLAALVLELVVRLLQLLRDALKTEEFSYCYLDGSTPAEQRQTQIQIFQEGKADVFLLFVLNECVFVG